MTYIIPYKGTSPQIKPSAYIAEGVAITGDVHIGEHSNIWFGVAMRGDVSDIRIGERTNIQDGSVIHVTRGMKGTHIGNDVTVGHMACLHACQIGDRAFIGMKACVLDGAIVEDEAMVAAGSLVTPNKRVPKHQLWAGSPARYMRDMTEEEIKFLRISADNYVKLGQEYKQQQ
jgi:carbonic anhydrase/acetyltransferase-like protein (isoleucine patch superfamily)